MSRMFDQDNAQQQEQPENKSAQEIFEELVGEGKKYSSPEELAKAYFHANSHISKLEQENEQYRVKTQAAKSVDEILAQLQQRGSDADKMADEATPESKPERTNDDVESLVQKALEAKLKERDSAGNQKQVAAKLREKFGDAAGKVFDEKSKELGLDLESLAGQSPAAVLSIFGLTGGSRASSQLPVSGDTTSHADNVPEQGTRAYAEYMYDKGKISRAEKYRLLHDFAKDPAQFNKQRSYK